MKPRLMTPGPTPVPEDTLLELAKPVGYHRSSEAKQIFAEVQEGLQYVFQTKNPIAILTSSGTGGMEAAMANVVAPGEKAILCIAGRWGERWKNIGKAFGIETVIVGVPYGKVVTPEMLDKALKEHPDAVAVFATLSETSTGVGHDIEAMGALVAKTRAVFIIDGISGVGAMECRVDDWHVDVCVAGSQKAFMLPPGLAYVSVSAKAWTKIESNPPSRTFYFDLKKYKSKIAENDTPFTPANTLIKAQAVSLRRFRSEGIENVWKRHDRMAKACRAGALAMGLELYPERPNNGLTVIKVPAGVDGNAVLSKMEKQYGVKPANGQDDLKGKIWRLSHMGYHDFFDVLAGLSALELVLVEMGFAVEPGSGLAAAQRAFIQG